ncbi:MAG: alpha/beta hydrolase [Pseudomonadota bacterium]|nr:alpha/beta hydrolase [Pseudomonadota bacterium]
MMADFADRYYTSADGIKLHYRDYAGPHEGPPILCIPGLTRNARDFEPVADRYAGQWRVIAVDLRGRGGSACDPDPANYAPPVYVADVLKLLDQLGIADAVFVGTSLGGLCTMLLADSDPDRIAGALLNDIGPVIDQAGIDRIGDYVGQDRRFASWEEAISEIASNHRSTFPKWGEGEWERFARRICREDKSGVRFDYDMALADNFKRAAAKPQIEFWPYYRALEGCPVTILRGAHSDLLSAETAAAMESALADVELVTVPDVGHTPNFEEPESQTALDRLLGRVLAR